jgi:hypothetical protein
MTDDPDKEGKYEMTLDNIKSLHLTVLIQEPDNVSCYWDQEWLLHWEEDLAFDVTQLIGNRKGPPGKTENTKSITHDPQKFVALLRDLADEIEVLAGLKNEAQDGLEELAAAAKL